MGSSSSQTPVTQQTTQTKDPWSAAQPFLINAMNSAQNLYNTNTGYQPYTGQTIADLHPWETQGIASQYSTAAGSLGGTPGVLAGQNIGTNLINNYGLSPQQQALYDQISTTQNPYLQGVIDQQMNAANARMAGSGRYGSGAHAGAVASAIAPTLAQDYQTRQAMRQQMLDAGTQRAGQWAQLMPTLDQAQYAPAERMAATGQFYTDYAQKALDDSLRKYNAQQAYPWEQLSRLNAIVGGAGGLGGTTVTTQPGATQPSTTQRLFGGALAGAGLGTAIFPGIGTAVGALGGGLLGML